MTDTESERPDTEPVTGRPPDADIRVLNPATGEIVGSVADTPAEQVAARIAELREHQREWAAIGANGRKEWLLKLQDWIIDNTESLADVLQSETGKPRVDSLIDPIFGSDLIGYYARRAPKFLADEHPAPHSPLSRVKRLTTVFEPYPVVGVITPWNFPLAMPILDVMPARGGRGGGGAPGGGNWAGGLGGSGAAARARRRFHPEGVRPVGFDRSGAGSCHSGLTYARRTSRCVTN
ncbi:aldehyde dehydrogenase family protein, partial [Nocardia flavorosea]|uniref:aldehyde dehydrogenase family protein n=1 Tax=Nocardia flavorosea TaxID=53429 RepID=UPI0024555223